MIAEDQSMVLGALAALLDMESDIEVVGQARDGEQALNLVRKLQPDVLLTDIEMPKVTGLELAAKVRSKGGPRVIILTTFARAGYLRRALEDRKSTRLNSSHVAISYAVFCLQEHL